MILNIDALSYMHLHDFQNKIKDNRVEIKMIYGKKWSMPIPFIG
ncbi:hypothetical protein [Methanobrevibacter sp.]|nr:hypothetical protein [uncultured Methanobrevibacter sp.]